MARIASWRAPRAPWTGCWTTVPAADRAPTPGATWSVSSRRRGRPPGEIGGEVTAHEIARRAGVGVGTFYRRVSTLEALLEAVLAEVLGEIVEKGDEGLADPDPWKGFCDFAAAYITLRNELCDISEALGGALGDARAELRERIRMLVERAQDAGAMRADIAWQDVAFLLVSVSTGDHTVGLHAGERQWDRNLRIVLDGLRTPEPAPLPGAPPTESAG
ncbi:TetR/AcrR family transcriptional regulator [Actinomadura madurae]|uniref:TetR/AcrR family transcriptional regulator n=2 Tax=Actinomadura madurae TaxID=1993 RepID=UPI0020D23BB9|nr:TetR/AcrR family transcriptional regulator [Actinomadura madurae]MCP9949459.1 TetR/AcrR family transcriptional regulator [Actinomadura madurae]MCP9978704.1 TetR/AcrR family transcriptional regulator [Actinomadura madurae]MCQ0009775.1 TetR/AcrR family transcriptional regulator [Actinomadura madurae]